MSASDIGVPPQFLKLLPHEADDLRRSFEPVSVDAVDISIDSATPTASPPSSLSDAVGMPLAAAHIVGGSGHSPKSTAESIVTTSTAVSSGSDASVKDPVQLLPPAVVAAKLEQCLFGSARQLLGVMERQTVPAKMLSYLVAAMLSALDELDKRYGEAGASSTLDAESVMPIFVYLITRSNLKRPHACMAYLANFAITAAK